MIGEGWFCTESPNPEFFFAKKLTPRGLEKNLGGKIIISTEKYSTLFILPSLNKTGF